MEFLQMHDHMVFFRCMLVDNNGFLVYHPDANFQYKHLIQLEPEVADSLIALGHMQQAQCKDFAWKVEYYTWKVSINTDEDTRPPFYKIFAIENTNVFIVVINLEELRESEKKTSDCCLSGTYWNEATLDCKIENENRCNKCPCNARLKYIICENAFDEVSIQLIICFGENETKIF